MAIKVIVELQAKPYSGPFVKHTKFTNYPCII
jgi:hypothetical protein